jgi:hypothetical protein
MLIVTYRKRHDALIWRERPEFFQGLGEPISRILTRYTFRPICGVWASLPSPIADGWPLMPL